MTRSARFTPLAGCVVLLVFLAGVAVPARSETDSKLELKMGTWMIRQCAGAGALRTGCNSGQYSIMQYLVLRENGTYEVYYYPTKEFRSRGNWEWDPVKGRVRWLSGINHDMGRGGTLDQYKGETIILLGTNTEAVFKEP